MGSALVFSLAACGGDDDAADTGGDTASVNAEKIYNDKSCVACHAADLTGGVGSDISKIGATKSEAEIKDAIVNGYTGDKGTMPAQNVTDEEANALSEWLAAKK